MHSMSLYYKILILARVIVKSNYNYFKGKLHKKPQPLGVFSNKTLTNFLFQIKPQPLKCYQKSPSWMTVLVTEDEIIFF